MSTARTNRHDIVTRLLKKYSELTGKPFKYPKSNVELTELRQIIDELTVTEPPPKPPREYKLSLERSALSGYDRIYVWEPDDTVNNALVFLLDKIIKANPSIKLVIDFKVKFISAIDPLKTEIVDLIQQPRVILADDDLSAIAKSIIDKYFSDVDEHTGVGSGWVFDHLVAVIFNVYKYDPLRVGKFVELPASIKATHCCINVKSDDDKCLLWSVLAALFPVDKDPNRASKYQQYSYKVNTTGLKFPVELKQLNTFVSNNSTLIPGGINVFGLDNSDKLFPMRLTENPNDATINLLYYKNHFVYIKNINGLLRKQFTQHREKHYFCVKCFAGFTKLDGLKVHQRYCIHDQRASYPKPDENTLSFKNHKNKLRLPVCIIFDFESIMDPIDSNKHIAKSRDTVKLFKHLPVAVAYKISSTDPTLDAPVKLYRRRSCSEEEPAVWLLRNLFADANRILSRKPPPKRLTAQQQQNQSDAAICHVCDKPFNDDKTANFCNITGEYNGAVHQDCSNRFKQHFIPVIAHNFRGYDSHFIISALADPGIQSLIGGKIIDGIPTNTEKFMSLTLGHLKFLDSMQFMNSSLEFLASLNKSFPSLDQHFNDKASLMHRKGIFPYEYLTDFPRLEEPTLSPHNEFYSSLTGDNVSAEEYQYASVIYSSFGCTNLGDYLDIYLIQDVLILNDIFGAFRDNSIRAFKLDPCWYVSSPGLAWDSMLQMSEIEFELITDPVKYQFIEKAIRGGISVITKRKATANNKQLDGFDPSLPIWYLLYIDANNLYEWAMSESMPYRCGSFIEECLFNALTENCTKDLSDSDYTFFVEVDVDVPERLHDLHNDYPFLAEKMTVNDSLLSQSQLANRIGDSSPHEKLVPNLLSKHNYVCHYRALQQAVATGLVVKKVHRALKVYQKKWLAGYIKFNTDMRAAATNDFEKEYYKLMNNSVFGKTMENVRNRCNIELVNKNTKRFSKLVASNDFISSVPIKDDLVFVKKHKTDILLSKPIYVGAAVLEISKTLMYDFHYNFIKNEFPGAQLCFSDTDSLLYHIPGQDCQNDFYSSIYQHRERFDLCDVSGEFNDNSNKKVIGKFKDELNFKPIREFIGLRPKMYSIDAPSKTINKAKGVKRSVVKKSFTHQKYSDVHDGAIKNHRVEMIAFRSNKHVITTDKIVKSGLINFDDKRYYDDNINTYAIGHYRIQIPEVSPLSIIL